MRYFGIVTGEIYPIIGKELNKDEFLIQVQIEDDEILFLYVNEDNISELRKLAIRGNFISFDSNNIQDSIVKDVRNICYKVLALDEDPVLYENDFGVGTFIFNDLISWDNRAKLKKDMNAECYQCSYLGKENCCVMSCRSVY